jgi:general secretion pathway protein C
VTIPLSWTRLRLATLVVLVLALAVQTARLVWAVATPIGPFGRPPAAPPAPASDLAVLARFDPFARGGAGAGPTPGDPAAEAGFKLFGVRADGRGGGSAILDAGDGKQAAYRNGDAVGAFVLAQVFADHVVLSQAGRSRTVYFTPLSAQPASSPPTFTPASAVAAPPAGGIDPEALSRDMALKPRVESGRVRGYALSSGGPGGAALQAAGLQPGDVLLSVNGADLSDPTRVAPALAEGREATIRYERDGQVHTTTIRIAQP